ncbi:radical SAM protein [bacterium]|nr:radical SAM protein [bacterium]
MPLSGSPETPFPRMLSLTVTNACNLRCRMCGQWSGEGYARNDRGEQARTVPRTMTLDDWKRVVDEAAAAGLESVLIRGGEPFLMPGLTDLLDHIRGKGLFTSIDTNGTRLADFAADLVRLGRIHVTISVDGPPDVHEAVRGVPGCFSRIEEGLRRLSELEEKAGVRISRSICFTVSPWSVAGLGSMPDTARRLGIGTLVMVPYYYVPSAVGAGYEKQMAEKLGVTAFSWRGFRHETSGVDFDVFLEQLRMYRKGLRGIRNYPYLPLSEDQYRVWFSDAVTPVGPPDCANSERLLDIQPGGEANFCVDFPDYEIGNVLDSTLGDLWNGERAARFRAVRREAPFAVCHRCGARHMSETRED